jgi:Uma2 family endonuclease
MRGTPRFATAGDLLDRLGNVPPARVRLDPEPGTATRRDLLRLHRRVGLCELIDGTLVTKPSGLVESAAAFEVALRIGLHRETDDLGYVCVASGLVGLKPGLVRSPDVAFYRWEWTPNGCVPPHRIGRTPPDLAVELLVASNTRREIDRKVGEYFAAGVVLVWTIDLRRRSAGRRR